MARKQVKKGVPDATTTAKADGKSVAWTEQDAKEEDAAEDRDPPKDVVQRDRLRIDTRKWLLSKALPKIYGDKITQEVTGKDGSALVPVLNVTIGKPKSEG